MLQFHSSRQSAQQRICVSFVVAAGLLAATLARADYSGFSAANGDKVYAGELRKPLEKLPVLLDAMVVLPKGHAVPYEQAED